MSDPNDGRRAFLIQTAANVDHLVRLNLKIIKWPSSSGHQANLFLFLQMSDPNDGRRAFLIQTAANVDHLVRLNLKIIITEEYTKKVILLATAKRHSH